LQDKSSTDLLGLLGLGFRIGEWAREINILESHIIGDPTFRFAGDVADQVDLRTTDTAYWLALYNKADHPDLKGLALHKLSDLGYPGMAEFLTKAYNESPYYSVRLQAFLLLQLYGGDHFAQLLEKSINDPYEFIRRKSVYAMGAIGSDHFIPYLVKIYLDNYLDERVHFNVTFTFDRMDFDAMEAEMKRQLDQNISYPDKEKVWEEFQHIFASRKRIAAMANDVTNREKPLKSRISAARMLRNNNYHKQVGDYLQVLTDTSEDASLRVALAEALGWFNNSYRREEIVAALREVAAQPQASQQLSNEINKSIARLEHFMQ
ncbi:HEAT repeat domain-containing protein, partial [Petrimonas mucosa]